MKDIKYMKIVHPKNRTKFISISQVKKTKESTSKVRKSFVYRVIKAKEIAPKVQAPEIRIKKVFDTKKATEAFHFNVKGSFYMTHNRMPVRVEFRHSLHIEISWKTKVFSPKKSEILT